MPRPETRLTQLCLSACCGLLLSLPAATVADDEIEVGLTKQLFIDDHVIKEMQGVRRVLNQPERHPRNPLIQPTEPWEGTILETPTVVWDEAQQLFHMYYWALHSDGIYTCYARSADGIEWEKPRLNLHTGPDGSRENNIVLRGEGTQARVRYVAIDPHAGDPNRRFVAMYIDNVPGLTEFVAYSPDGLNWTTETKIGDLRNVTGAPSTPGPRFFLVEQGWHPGDPSRYRGIWRTQSEDLKNWSGGTWIIERLPNDDPHLEFYHATSHFDTARSYHGMHLGYLLLFHADPQGQKLPDGTLMAGNIDIGLMASRDTVHWQRVDRERRFLPLGEPGAWDAGMLFLQPELVVGDELRFYYAGWRHGHSRGIENVGAIGLATLRLDGFVSIESIDGEGTLTTKPFTLDAAELRVNADASDGAVRVALLDGEGTPLPGFNVDDCRSITSDGLDTPVTWENDASLKPLIGRQVRVRFHVRGGAKLYAFRVAAD